MGRRPLSYCFCISYDDFITCSSRKKIWHTVLHCKLNFYYFVPQFRKSFHIVKITVCEIYKYSCEQWPSESISRRAVHHEKPVDSSHTPYRCTGLEVRRGGRRYGCDECSVAAVQTSQLCSGLSAAPANTNMLERNRPLCLVVCVWWREGDFTHPKLRATDVGCLFNVHGVFV